MATKSYSRTRTLVECALMIAVGTVLAQIKIFEMPFVAGHAQHHKTSPLSP